MAFVLSEIEIRVLGSLIEKQLATPEYYPLTLNALVAACNQKSSRDPVVNYNETQVLGAVDDLRDKNLVYVFYGSTSRTPKYKHMMPEVFELSGGQVALMSILMLRGHQTLGELRERTGRLYEFSDFGERMHGTTEHWKIAEKMFRLACKRHGLNQPTEETRRENTFRRPTPQLGLFD